MAKITIENQNNGIEIVKKRLRIGVFLIDYSLAYNNGSRNVFLENHSKMKLDFT